MKTFRRKSALSSSQQDGVHGEESEMGAGAIWKDNMLICLLSEILGLRTIAQNYIYGSCTNVLNIFILRCIRTCILLCVL